MTFALTPEGTSNNSPRGSRFPGRGSNLGKGPEVGLMVVGLPQGARGQTGLAWRAWGGRGAGFLTEGAGHSGRVWS